MLIRRSKGDQEGQGAEIAIPRGYRLRPVEAVPDLARCADITRSVGRGGRVSGDALVDDSASRYARRVGLDVAAYSGYSLRSGFLTTAAAAGASVFKMMEVSRHRSVDVLRGYVRRPICSTSTLERRSYDAGICTASIPIMHSGA